MSSNASNLIEKTLSQSQSQFLLKTFRGVEEEVIAKINNFKLKIPHVKEKLEEIIRETSNPEDHTITIKELNKTIYYESQENIDKLMNYLSYLSELKHTIPDFFHTPSLNSVFTRNFGSFIDSQKGLLQKTNENSEKLKKIIPSKNYLGIYIPNVEIKDIESILCFLILEEFFMLSSKDARLRSDNLVIEANSDEIPQHISIFNPFFNTLVAYAGEKEQHLYLLFLTDVLELMGPDGADFPFGSRSETIDFNKKPKFSTAVVKLDSRIPDSGLKKYDNMKTSLPDISLEQAQKFTTALDSDNDFRITIQDIVRIAQKHQLVLDESVINDMFEDIFQRRCVTVETQRRKPVDAHEVFHAVRYKYKKDNETQSWVTSSRPYRDQWLMLMKLVGIELPKHALPSLKAAPLYCNYELESQKFSASAPNFNKTQTMVVKEKKPEILKKQYQPEAGVLIQNTQHITELYCDDRDHAKQEDSNKNAFQTLVNAKYKDLSRKTEYQTVGFDTQEYYKETLRLSKDPELYLNEKVNPIFKYLPVKKDYVYQQNPQDVESLKDTRSGLHSEEAEYEESIEVNNGSKRVTMYSIKDPLTRMSRSTKSIMKPTPTDQNARIFGSLTRHTTLTSSIKHREHSPQNYQSKRPIFMTTFKIPDNETLRFEKARLEPIVDGYNPQQNHVFRSDNPPEFKPPFVDRWQEEIPDVIKDSNEKDVRPREALEQELYEREQHMMRLRGIKKNSEPWTRYFKKAPIEKGFITHKYPDFLEKGDYSDGFVRVAAFLKQDTGAEQTFKLFHRSLRKTDKNMFFGDTLPSKF